MTPGERLIAKIRATGAGEVMPPTVAFMSTHAGYWQRRQGAWSWFLEDPTGPYPLDIGSQYPRSALTGRIQALRIETGEWCIQPFDPRDEPKAPRGG